MEDTNKASKATRPPRTDVFWVHPDQIEVEDGLNPRYDYGDIKGLAKSIAENGVELPLKVARVRGTDRFLVRSGHRRQRAFDYLKQHDEAVYQSLKVPVMLENAAVTLEQRNLNLIIHNDGKSFTLLEEAIVYDRAVANGQTPKEIAGIVGKSETHIKNLLLLLTATEATLAQIRAGKLTASLVIEELKRAAPADVEKEVVEAAKRVGEGKKVTKKHLPDNTKTSKATNNGLPEDSGEAKVQPKRSDTQKDMKVSVADIESLYTEVEQAFDGVKANSGTVLDFEKLGVLKAVAEHFRGLHTLEELTGFFAKDKKPRR